MHQDILGRTDILNVKKDSITWQTEAARSQDPTQPASIHGSWYSSPTIAAPQASHPIAPPPPPPAPASQRSPPTQPQREEWDDTYLSVLSTQDPKQLRELLARSNPEIVMPLNGPGPLSQAVILTLLRRLAATVGETPPWLQRAATVLNINVGFSAIMWTYLRSSGSFVLTQESLISPYVTRVVPNVKAMLNTIEQRLSILPGPPQLMDSVRTISDIQDTLTRKQT
ncbi:hypothetical protein F5J12DRAFT_889955 [Pisolithus orientalis]|uniref:uncharacterized protein n=1 Tax=Pisolithus orientalis TaxID=936130 RepID=UPI002223FE83|nr:uncharacterized protein F5J12DRAFT_889955 [Pisolithus orientalis]KAI6019658.1 hypothetical protein F5J12DRAFT_889955 [Pisolithus orientalis]